MATYLVQASYTTEAIAALIKRPQNRTSAVSKAIQKLGGKMIGIWLSFGDQDVIVLAEMPDNVSAAAMSLAVAGGGVLRSTKTTVLLSVDEGMAALKKAGACGYKAFTTKK